MRAGDIDERFVPRICSGVASIELDGEGVLYDDQTRETHLLNPTAQQVWSHLDGTTTVGGIVAELAAAYRLDPGVIRDDVVEVIRHFGRNGLLTGVRRETEPAPEV